MVDVVFALGKPREIVISDTPSDTGTSNARLLSPRILPMIFTRKDIIRDGLALEGSFLEIG